MGHNHKYSKSMAFGTTFLNGLTVQTMKSEKPPSTCRFGEWDCDEQSEERGRVGSPEGQVKTRHDRLQETWLTKRLTQESSETVTSAVPSTNMSHPLRWHPHTRSLFFRWHWVLDMRSALTVCTDRKPPYFVNIGFNNSTSDLIRVRWTDSMTAQSLWESSEPITQVEEDHRAYLDKQVIYELSKGSPAINHYLDWTMTQQLNWLTSTVFIHLDRQIIFWKMLIVMNTWVEHLVLFSSRQLERHPVSDPPQVALCRRMMQCYLGIIQMKVLQETRRTSFTIVRNYR